MLNLIPEHRLGLDVIGRLILVVAVCVAAVACANGAGEPKLMPIPRFKDLPPRPNNARSVEARRAWLMYQDVVARQIAMEALLFPVN